MTNNTDTQETSKPLRLWKSANPPGSTGWNIGIRLPNQKEQWDKENNVKSDQEHIADVFKYLDTEVKLFESKVEKNKKYIDDELKKLKTDNIGILSLFAALIAFLSAEIQIIKSWLDAVLMASVLIFVLWFFLIFVLTIFHLSKREVTKIKTYSSLKMRIANIRQWLNAPTVLALLCISIWWVLMYISYDKQKTIGYKYVQSMEDVQKWFAMRTGKNQEKIDKVNVLEDEQESLNEKYDNLIIKYNELKWMYESNQKMMNLIYYKR